MKKFISLALAMVLVLSIGSFASATEISDKQKATNFLLNSGWTQADIDDLLSDEALLVYADAISSEVSEKEYFRVTETDVIQVSKSEFDAGVAEAKEIAAQNMEILTNSVASAYAEQSLASQDPVVTLNSQSPVVTTTDGYMEYYVQETDLGNGKYAIGARYQWDIEPDNRRIDVFGLGHDGTLSRVTTDDVYYIYKADLYVIDQYGQISGPVTSQTSSPTTMCCDTGGVAVGQDLYDDDITSTGGVFYENHRGFVQYNVTKANLYDQTGYICATYKHQQGAWAISPSISYPLGFGLSVSYSTFFKTMSPNPDLSFSI